MEKNFIAYIDDDGKKKEVWAEIVEKTLSYISFKFQSDVITIPFHRVLKIKEKKDKQ